MAARRIIVVASLIAACNAVPNPSQPGSAQVRSTQASTTCGSSTPRNPNVLIIADDPANAAVGTLASILAGAGDTVTTTVPGGLFEYQWTGDAPYDPGSFDVVVHMDRTWQTPLSDAAQQLLTSYVQAGHGFVAFQYDGYEKDANAYASIAPLLPMGFDWTGNYECMGCDVSASVDPNQTSHPIVAGLSGSSFTFHADTWIAPTDAIDPTAYPNAAVLLWSLPPAAAYGTSPEPLVIAAQVGSGRVVNFGIVPGDNGTNALADAPSADINTLLVNAVSWAANVQTGTGSTNAPVAVAGNDQQLSCVAPNTAQAVTLDGSGSTGTPPLTYKWTDQNGNVVSTDVKPTLMLEPGTYTFSLVVSSNGCDSSPSTVHVSIVADTGPSITINSQSPMTLECGTTFVAPSATPVSTCSASLGPTTSNVNPNVPGTYTYTYTATDQAGLSAQASLTVDVVDTLKPVVTLAQQSQTVECGLPYAPPGIATAVDKCAGQLIPGAISTVNSAVVGSYSVTYAATDPSGNTGSATLPVSVVDTTKPVITMKGSSPVNVECGDSYVDAGATVGDTCDQHVALNTVSTVNSAVPGNYSVSYSATDASGNSSAVSRGVMVADTLAPIVTLVGSSSTTLQCGVDSYVEQGATAFDKCSGALTPGISGSVNSHKVGQYAVSYSATDGVGHTGTATRTVSVVDTIAPSISVKPMLQFVSPPDQVKTFNLSDCASAADSCDAIDINAAGSIVSIYSDEKGMAQDDVDFLSASSFALRLDRDGKGNGHVYGITFRVRDAAGNTSTALCKIGVSSSLSTVPIDDGPASGYTVTPTSQRMGDQGKKQGPKPKPTPKKLALGHDDVNF